MTVQMNYLAIVEEITACDHLIRMAIIPKFTLSKENAKYYKSERKFLYK